MRQCLCRITINSKTIITGDITQIDLEKNVKSGLIEAQSLLNNINGIAFSSFSNNDVIRHPLVKKIIDAYK